MEEASNGDLKPLVPEKIVGFPVPKLLHHITHHCFLQLFCIDLHNEVNGYEFTK